MKIKNFSNEEIDWNDYLFTKNYKTVVLPDYHKGYCFPIGTAVETEDLIVEAVGFDINCGVRAVKTNLKYLNKKIWLNNKSIELQELADLLYVENKGFDQKLVNSILKEGLLALYKRELINLEELVYTEDFGSFILENIPLSNKAQGKAVKDLGTLGRGNHFIEIQFVDEIFDKIKANELGLEENSVIFMVHTGSRGVGHRTCTEFINGRDVKEYLDCVKSCSNFAFCNRSFITSHIKKVLKNIFKEVEINIISDNCHNIIKEVGNAFLYRKGASQCIPSKIYKEYLTDKISKFNYKIPLNYKIRDFSVIPVGGSMGTFSYLLYGMDSEKSMFSTIHGAGRKVPRSEAKKIFNLEDLTDFMKEKGIVYRAKSNIVDEGPNCYKNIEEIVLLAEQHNISGRILRVKPLLVIKD